MFTRLACIALLFATSSSAFAQIHSVLKPSRSGDRRFVVLNETSDGKVIMGVHENRVVGLGAESGKELFSYPTPQAYLHSEPRYRLLSGDGNSIVVGDLKKVRVLDPVNGAVRLEFDEKGSPMVPERGSIIAVFDRYSASLNIYDMKTGKKTSRFVFPCKTLSRFVLAPDGKTIAFLGDNKVVVCDLQTADTIATSARVQSPNGLTMSNDGRTIAVEGFLTDRRSHGIVLMAADTLKPIKTLYSPSYLEDLAISPDGAWVAACASGRGYLVDVATGELKGKLLGGNVRGVEFSRDSTKVLTIGHEEEIVRWDVADAVRTIAPKWKIVPSKPEAYDLAVDPSNKTLVAAGYTGLGFYDIETGKPTHQAAQPSTGKSATKFYYRLPTFSDDGKYLAALARFKGEYGLTVYDVQARRFVFLEEATRYIVTDHPPQFSIDGKKLFLWGRAGWNANIAKVPDFLDRTNKNFYLDTATWEPRSFNISVKDFHEFPFLPFRHEKSGGSGFGVFDLASKERQTPGGDPPGYPQTTRKSKNDQFIATASGNRLYVWHLASDKAGSPFTAFNGTGSSFIRHFDYSHDSRFLAVVSEHEFTWLWEIETGRLLGRLPHAWAHQCRFTPDGHFLLTTDNHEGNICLWDIAPLTALARKGAPAVVAPK